MAAARRFEERWKPSLAERLQQSQRDRRLRGVKKVSLKKSEPERSTGVWRPGNKAFEPIRILGNDFFVNNVTIDTTTHGNTRVLVEGISQAMNNGRTTGIGFTTDIYNGLPLNQRTMELMKRETAQAWGIWSTQQTLTQTITCNSCTGDAWNTWYIRPSTEYRSTVQWTTWADTATSGNILITPFTGQRSRFEIAPETEAQRAARERQYAQLRAEQQAADLRYKEQEAQRKKAAEVAMQLLVSLLNPEQAKDLKNNKFFYVKALSGRLYRIDEGISGNVKVVNPTTKRVIESLCIHQDNVPAGDVMLIQKLLIETAEEKFRAHANITAWDTGGITSRSAGLLDNKKLAEVIPLRRAA